MSVTGAVGQVVDAAAVEIAAGAVAVAIVAAVEIAAGAVAGVTVAAVADAVATVNSAATTG